MQSAPADTSSFSVSANEADGAAPPPSEEIKKKKKKPKSKRAKLPSWIAAPVRILESAFLNSAISTLGRLSPRARMTVARAAARFALTVMPFRKAVVLSQLRMAFPDMSESERTALLPEIYTNLMAFGLEMLNLARSTPADVEALMESRIENISHLSEWREKKQGFVLVTAHMGNWEWAGAYLASHGIEVAGAAKPMHDPVGEKFIRTTRERFGVNATSTRLSPRQVTAHLIKIIKRGGTAALPADQDARHAGIFVDFLGHPAATFTGPAWLSYRLGVPIIPTWGIRTPEGRLRYVWDEPIWPDTKAEMEGEVRRLTEYHVRSLERTVRAHPAQYLWFHRRWKTQPKRNLKRAASEQTK